MNSDNQNKKTFNKAIRGYDMQEVDAYVSSLQSKYDDLKREYAELEYRLNASMQKSKEAEAGEEQLRSTITMAQKAADKIINDAQSQADLLYAAAKDNADRVLRNFRNSIASEALVLRKLKLAVADMRSVIYKQYLKNIEQLEDLAPKSKYEAELSTPETEEYIRAVIDGMKSDVENMKADEETSSAYDGDVTIKRTSSVSVEKKYRIASVRETIKELNKRILSNDASIDGEGEIVSGESLISKDDDIRQTKREMPKKKGPNGKDLFNG